MGKIIEFIGNNYVWFLTIALLLLFALIGYIYDSKKNKTNNVKKEEEEDHLTVEEIEELDNNLSDTEELSENTNIESESNQPILEDKMNSNLIDEKPEMPIKKEEKTEIEKE